MPGFGLGTQWSTTKLTCLYSIRLTAKLDFSISSPVRKAFVLLHGFPWEKASSEEFCMTQKQNIWSWKEYINAFRQFCLTRKCHINFRQKSKYGKTKFLTEKVSSCKIKKKLLPFESFIWSLTLVYNCGVKRLKARKGLVNAGNQNQNYCKNYIIFWISYMW